MWFIANNKKKKKSLVFKTICYEWLEYKRKNVKQSTFANYSYIIKKYIITELETANLEMLEKIDFNDNIENLSQVLKPKTVRDIITVLKSILNYANDKYNSNIKIKNIKLPKMDEEPLAILNKEEKIKLENYCVKENTLRSIGIIICLNTGLRIGEMCAIKWKDIDLDKKELCVRSTLQRIYVDNMDKTKIIIDKPKSKNSVRNIPISNKLCNLLRGLDKKYNENEFFLTGDAKKMFEPRTYREYFCNVLKKSKIKKQYKFHILRHTFATDCIEVGMDIKSLSELLGHANVEITLNKYVHSSYERKKKYLEKL